MIKNDEALMTNDEGTPNVQMIKPQAGAFSRHSDFGIPSPFACRAVASRRRVIRHLLFSSS
jgi:hypothetical protein